MCEIRTPLFFTICWGTHSILRRKRHKITLFYILELSKNHYMKGDLCFMNNNMIIPIKDVIIHEIKEYLDHLRYTFLTKKEQVCPSCGVKTIKVHDYRIQKVKHLKWFEHLTILFYKRRLYICVCGKIFASLAFVLCLQI